MAHASSGDQPESSNDCQTRRLGKAVRKMDQLRKPVGSGEPSADPFPEKGVGDPVFAIDLDENLLLQQLTE